MKGVYALYPDGQGAQRAVDGLRRAGVPDSEITVISSTPMEDFEFSHIDGKNRIWYIACFGGLVGFVGSYALTHYTSYDWPMNVGNMATYAWWAYLIVIFEMTMLGAILAAVITLVLTAGLGRRRPVLYDPAVSDGKILVGIENPSQGQMADLERALLSTPGVSLKTV